MGQKIGVEFTFLRPFHLGARIPVCLLIVVVIVVVLIVIVVV